MKCPADMWLLIWLFIKLIVDAIGLVYLLLRLK
jgi:hypothetical protein